MIRHIVLFKLKEPSEENLSKTKEILLSMSGRVPELRSIEVGTDFLRSERSYDIALSVEVENREPYHCGVVKPHMHAVRSASVAADYEI